MVHQHVAKCSYAQTFTVEFPQNIAEDYELEDEESATCPPLNFGEAIRVLLGVKLMRTKSVSSSKLSTIASPMSIGPGCPISTRNLDSPSSSTLPMRH